ncbi:MAG: hypothetical protein ACREQT_14925 [Candidatus Binataceae bacterium]
MVRLTKLKDNCNSQSSYSESSLASGLPLEMYFDGVFKGSIWWKIVCKRFAELWIITPADGALCDRFC